MVDLDGDISKLVFRQAVKNRAGDISIDGQLLGIFLELDGKKELEAVAKKAGLKLGQLRELISKLLDLELIEPVGMQEGFLDQEFLKFLHRQLAEALGPIAKVLVEDYAAESGFRLSQIPISHAAAMIDALAREIQREEKMKIFKTNMVNKLKEMGY